MAWQDIFAGIGGALQGAGAGMAQVQDQRQRDLQRQLQERQLQQQQEEQKRRAVQAAYESMVGGFKTDLATAQPMIEAGFAFEKGEDGSLVKPMSMAERRAEIEAKAQEQRLINQESQMIARDQIVNDPSGFMDRPWDERNVMQFAAGGQLELQSPEDKLRYSERLAAAGPAAQARVDAARIAAEARRGMTEEQRLKFQSDKMAEAMRMVLQRPLNMGKGPEDPEVQAQALAVFKTIMQASGFAPGQDREQVQPQAGTPVLGGKYLRVQ